MHERHHYIHFFSVIQALGDFDRMAKLKADMGDKHLPTNGGCMGQDVWPDDIRGSVHVL